jgi:HK97 gp10 family phage protein
MKETLELKGADFLLKKLEAMGPTVSNKAARRGVTKAAMFARRELRKAAPDGPSGNLKKAISYKTYGRPAKGGPKIAYIGLRKQKGEDRGRWYYRTLEFPHARGAPYNTFFESAWNGIKGKVAQMIVDETTKALYAEAAKVYRQSLARKGK